MSAYNHTPKLVLVKVRCVGCGATKEVRATDIADVPICDMCFMPMATVSVRTTRKGTMNAARESES